VKCQVSNVQTVVYSNLDKDQSVKHEQRAITPKPGIAVLRWLCTALLLNEIYLPTEFLVDSSCNFRVMF